MPVSPTVTVCPVPQIPWSWIGVPNVSVSPLWITQRARSLNTYGRSSRSIHNTPGSRAFAVSDLRGTSAFRTPLPLIATRTLSAPREFREEPTSMMRDFSNVKMMMGTREDVSNRRPGPRAPDTEAMGPPTADGSRAVREPRDTGGPKLGAGPGDPAADGQDCQPLQGCAVRADDERVVRNVMQDLRPGGREDAFHVGRHGAVELDDIIRRYVTRNRFVPQRGRNCGRLRERIED